MGAPGVIPLDLMRTVADGMSADDVRAALGDPLSRITPAEVEMPGDIATALGSSCLAPRGLEDADEVWRYDHDRRGKLELKDRVTSYLAFRSGVLVGGWRVHQEPRG